MRITEILPPPYPPAERTCRTTVELKSLPLDRYVAIKEVSRSSSKYWIWDIDNWCGYAERTEPNIFIRLDKFLEERSGHIPEYTEIEVLPDISTPPVIEKEINPEEIAGLDAKRRFLLKNTANKFVDAAFKSAEFPSCARRWTAANFADAESLDKIKNYKVLLLPLAQISAMSQFFSAPALELIKATPNSPEIRGFMLSKLGVMPAPELDTYEKLEEWIIWNVESKTAGAVIPSAPVNPPTAPNNRRMPLEIRLSVSETEVGRADYTATRSGRPTLGVSLEDLEQLAEESDDADDLRNRILMHLKEDESLMDDTETHDYEYDSEECTDTDNREVEFIDLTAAEAAIREYVRLNMPEQYERLYN